MCDFFFSKKMHIKFTVVAKHGQAAPSVMVGLTKQINKPYVHTLTVGLKRKP